MLCYPVLSAVDVSIMDSSGLVTYLIDNACVHPACPVSQGLAKSIAWDGEGATCLMEVTCRGAADEGAANAVARSIAGSSLVKAAVYGHDPNWGRIACAAG